jgi:glyoxylase-like metal-dependent hydrolase (beta-lactamase superfamily II)
MLLALTLAATAVQAANPYPPVTVDVPVRQVAERTWYALGAPGIATDNQGFISNAGFVITDEGVVVFDALGSPSLAWALREHIRTLTDKPVVKVVVSHYHADHIYGLQVFQDEGAEIIAPAGVFDYLGSPAAEERLEERRFSLDPWVNENTRLVRPDRVVQGEYRFELGGIDFQLNYLGSAHSDGDLTLYVVQEGVLFSGDIIFEGRIPFVGDADTKRWLAALERMETEGLKALVPGHGPAARDPQAAVGRTREYLAYLREVMGAAVDELQDFDSAYSEADWSRFARLPAFEAANRRNAYQVYLSMETEALAR